VPRNQKGQFIKGNKEGGRKALPDDIMAARNLSYEEMCRMVIDIRSMTLQEAETRLSPENALYIPLGERAIMKAYVNLDYKGITDYENRLWGKAKETVDLDLGGTDFKIIVENATTKDQGD
jgi:hypothetical protein